MKSSTLYLGEAIYSKHIIQYNHVFQSSPTDFYVTVVENMAKAKQVTVLEHDKIVEQQKVSLNVSSQVRLGAVKLLLQSFQKNPEGY